MMVYRCLSIFHYKKHQLKTSHAKQVQVITTYTHNTTPLLKVMGPPITSLVDGELRIMDAHGSRILLPISSIITLYELIMPYIKNTELYKAYNIEHDWTHKSWFERKFKTKNASMLIMGASVTKLILHLWTVVWIKCKRCANKWQCCAVDNDKITGRRIY